MDTPESQSETPNTEPGSQPGTVVHGNVTTGRDFIGRDQITNKTFIGKLIVSPWAWVSGIVIIAVAVVLVGVASNARQLQSLLPTPSPVPTPLPTATAMAFAPAQEGESLIVIADFDNRSEGKYQGVEPAQYIYDPLDEQAKKDNLQVRVEHLHAVLHEKDARLVGEIYSATLLIWGWYDGLSVKPVIERIRKTTYVPRASVERLSIADPNKVEPVITGDLPNQVSYLTLLTLGLEQYARGNLTETLHYFATIMTSVSLNQIPPSNRGEVYFWRGLAYDRQGDYERAIADATQALQLRPDFEEAYFWRGVAYAQQGDYDRAIGDYDQAIQLKPEEAQTYLVRGVAYGFKGDKVKAIADFTQAIQLKPDEAQTYLVRGLTYEQQGDYEGAIADATQAIQRKLGGTEPYLVRGYAYEGKKDYDRAIADFTQAIQLKPQEAQTYFIRGVAYGFKGDKERAIADCKKTLELSSDPTLRAEVTDMLNLLEAQP